MECITKEINYQLNQTRYNTSVPIRIFNIIIPGSYLRLPAPATTLLCFASQLLCASAPAPALVDAG